MPPSLKALEKQVLSLPPQEKLELLEHLVHDLRKSIGKVRESANPEELYGAGKGVWDEDAQDYVDEGREEKE